MIFAEALQAMKSFWNENILDILLQEKEGKKDLKVTHKLAVEQDNAD